MNTPTHCVFWLLLLFLHLNSKPHLSLNRKDELPRNIVADDRPFLLVLFKRDVTQKNEPHPDSRKRLLNLASQAILEVGQAKWRKCPVRGCAPLNDRKCHSLRVMFE